MYNSNSRGNVLILAEHRDEEIDTLTLQLASKGRELADKLGVELNAVLVGYQLGLPAKQLLDKGFDKVFLVDNQLFKHYNTEIYSEVICDVLKKNMPELFLLGYSYLGMEVGPTVAAKLGVTLVSNCLDMELSGDGVIITRPMFGGQVHTRLGVGKLPLMLSVQKGALSVKIPDREHAILVPTEVDINPADIRIKVAALLEEVKSDTDITRANTLVAIGRGIANESGLDLARELADVLNGTIACSRPLVDWGWLPPEYHVGISGKTVHPKIYIACGISGASQHIAGMRDSQVVIAINNDPSAPIFRIAHYGVVGDIYEVLPTLIEVIKGA